MFSIRPHHYANLNAHQYQDVCLAVSVRNGNQLKIEQEGSL